MLAWVRKEFGEVPKELLVRERNKFLERNRSLDTRYSDWKSAWRNWMLKWWGEFGGREEVKKLNSELERLGDGPKYQD